MIQNIYIICGVANSGKTSLVRKILQGKLHNRVPKTFSLINGGGMIDIVIPRSQAMQEAKKTPQDCVRELNALKKKYNSQTISVVIVLRTKNHSQYVKAIQNAHYNISASVYLDLNLPSGISLPNPVAVGTITKKNYHALVNQVHISTKNHFGW